MTALPQPDLSRAVLIGTSVFDRLPDLPAVRNNLTELSRSLTDPDSGILPRDNCSIVDSPETTSRFMRRLRSVAQQAEDFLLVYYSGHGLRHETRDLLYLAVQDTDPDVPEGTAVRFDSVREIIENSPARTRLLILDCCYSGLALGAMSSGTIDSRDVEVGGTAVITSSPRNKISHSPPGEQFTAFTGELITLLRNGSRIPDEPLTVGTAFRSLRAALARRDLPEPKLKVTDTGNDMLLRRPTIHVKPRPVAPPAPVMRPVPKPELRIVPKVRPLPRLPEPRRAPPPQPTAASTLRTVPTMTPVPRPVAPPVTALRVSPMTPLAPPLPPLLVEKSGVAKKLIRALLADSGWLLLWVVYCLGSGYGIGGLFAAIIEPASDTHLSSDRGTAIGGLIFGAICGAAITLRVVQLRRRGRPSPALTSRMRLPVLITVVSFYGLLAVCLPAASFSAGDPPPPADQSGLSNLAIAMMVEYLLCLGIAVCGLEFYRRYFKKSSEGARTLGVAEVQVNP